MVIGEPTPGASPADSIKLKPQTAESVGTRTNPVFEAEPIFDAEAKIPHYVQYRDLFAPACLDELADKLASSHGKAFFIAHPFYLVDTWSEDYRRDAFQGRINDRQMINFFQRMKESIPSLIKSGKPVIILQELGYSGETWLEDENLIRTQFAELCGYLKQLSDEIDPNSLFIMFTERGGPHPLRGKSEEKREQIEVIADRMESLKKAGLVTGIVAGREFKSSEGDQFQYYAAAEDKDYGWGKTADNAHGGFLLKDYFDKVRKDRSTPHPLQIIRPDQCVGELLRVLAMNGIRPAITTLTYPDQIQTASYYVEYDYKGRKVYTTKQK